ncbi:hypothetical protein SprV_0301069500 [Sparganum proliferum]
MQWPAPPTNLRRTAAHPDQHLLPPLDAGEDHLDVSPVATLAPAGLFPRPEARPAGRADGKGDSECRRVDRQSARHLQDADLSKAPQETSSNELVRRLASPPLAAAAADEHASVEDR